MRWWEREGWGSDWAQALVKEDPETASSLRRATYAGRPFGSQGFVEEMSREFGRHWERGRPKKEAASSGVAANADAQLTLF